MAHLEERTDKKTDKKTAKRSKKTKPPAHVDSDLTKVEYRTFNFKQDLKAIKRIWREVGWVTEDARASSVTQPTSRQMRLMALRSCLKLNVRYSTLVRSLST